MKTRDRIILSGLSMYNARGVAIVANDREVKSLSTNVLLIYTQWLNFRRFYDGTTDNGNADKGYIAQNYIAQGAFQVLALFNAFISQEKKDFLEQLSDTYRCA